MKITLSPSLGARPKISPSQLGTTEAQTANNCKLWSGEIRPWAGLSPVASIDSDGPQTVWKYNGEWLSWDSDVDCVRSLIAEDTRDILIYSGDGAPKYRTKTGDVFPLGIPVPVDTPVTTRSGTGSSGLQSITHVYTYVTSVGWESANSYPSTPVSIYSGDSAVVSNIATPPEGCDIEKIRIYRSATGTSSCEYQFVEEIDPATSYTDDMSDTDGVLLESDSFIPPTDTLHGFVFLPGGLIAGFDGREVRMCEPYIPYAFPDSYSYTIPFDIVGLGVAGTALVVCTKGPVFVLSGTSPDAMYVTRMQGNTPCLSKRSVVSMPEGVAFASSDGLYLCDGSLVECITRGIFSRDEWEPLCPETFIAKKLEDKYLFFNTVDETTSGHVLDFSNNTSTYTTVDVPALGLFVDDETNDLYVIMYNDNAYILSQWEGDTSLSGSMYFSWLSKCFDMLELTNFSAGRVRARYDDAAEMLSDTSALLSENEVLFAIADSLGGDLGTEQVNKVALNGSLLNNLSDTSPPGITFSLYADGVLQFSRLITNSDPFRLPSGFRGRKYEIKVEGNFPVIEVSVANSVGELRGVN